MGVAPRGAGGGASKITSKLLSKYTAHGTQPGIYYDSIIVSTIPDGASVYIMYLKLDFTDIKKIEFTCAYFVNNGDFHTENGRDCWIGPSYISKEGAQLTTYVSLPNTTVKSAGNSYTIDTSNVTGENYFCYASAHPYGDIRMWDFKATYTTG